MRKITSHQVNPTNDKLSIEVIDEPGAGGANHQYLVSGFDLGSNPTIFGYREPHDTIEILFQNGPIAEAGVNGLTHEVLLAIVIDRLQSFQNGPYACSENAEALKHAKAAQESLLSRTRARMARGVEGTHKI